MLSSIWLQMSWIVSVSFSAHSVAVRGGKPSAISRKEVEKVAVAARLAPTTECHDALLWFYGRLNTILASGVWVANIRSLCWKEEGALSMTWEESAGLFSVLDWDGRQRVAKCVFQFIKRHYFLRILLFYGLVVCIIICYWIKVHFPKGLVRFYACLWSWVFR